MMDIKKKTICLVSLFGIGNKGGVERVSYYLYDILVSHFGKDDVRLVTKTKLNFGSLDKLIQPVLVSIKLLFIKNKFIVANSWHCYLARTDLSIHHGTSAGYRRYVNSKKIGPIFTAKMEKVSAKRAKHILAVSENCKEELIDFYKIKETKISVLNNFVDDKKYTAKEIRKDSNDFITVLFCGSLDERKGLPKLKEFSDYIENNCLDLRLIIATQRSDKTECFNGNSRTEVLVGLQPEEMPGFYKKGDVLFFPTKYEGFSMATMEALSTGLPVVGTDAAIPKEIRSYPFCHLVDKDVPCDELSKIINDIYNVNKDKSQEIHNVIANDFGREVYERKFISFVESNL